MDEMQSISRDGLVVCASGGKEYTTRDVIEAALFRGEAEPVWMEFLRGVAADDRASEQDLDIADGAIEGAAEEFRYQHDLITAEETERWLADHALTMVDFTDYFHRRYWRTNLDEEIVPQTVDFGPAPAELREMFIAEVILSGTLEPWAIRLMWRLAALATDASENANDERIAKEHRIFLERTKMDAAKSKSWLNRIGCDQDWLDQMLAMEAAYRTQCDAVLTSQSQKKEMATMRLPLTRFAAEMIEVESRDAAKEALFCIREDGMSMQEVATEGRYPYRTVSFLQEDIPEDLQQKFLSVVAGEVLDPLPRGDGFQLYRVTEKIEPRADDPAVRQRIDDRILRRYFSELASKTVQPRLSSLMEG